MYLIPDRRESLNVHLGLASHRAVSRPIRDFVRDQIEMLGPRALSMLGSGAPTDLERADVADTHVIVLYGLA